MPKISLFSVSLSSLALALASPALAVTAEELWAEWQVQSEGTGQTITATEVVPGTGTLTLRGVRTTYSDGEVSALGTVDEIVMTEAADGSVAIDMSDVYALTVTFPPEAGGPSASVTIDMTMPDLAITVSGEVGARVYDYTASRITIEDGPITGGSGAPPTIDMTIAIEDMAARYEIDGSDPENIAYTTTSEIGGIAGAIDILPPPTEAGRLKLTFALGATTLTGAGQLGNVADLAANPDTIPAGFDLRGEMTYAGANLDLTFEHPEDAFNLFASNEGGSVRSVFAETEVDFRVTATGSSTYFAGADLPLPVEFSVGSAEVAFRMPLAASADPQPVTMRLAYQDVDLGEGIWGLADPAGTFPRDPITVIADLAGNIRILTDLMAVDPTQMGAPPAEPVDVTLNDLRISAVGATLTGTGSATFAAGPMPMPVGTVDLQLAGGNGLLDRLQASGLVPIEQIAMARGLLGAFARPGATPDTLETTIQFTEGGGITANGVPLQ